MGHLPAPKHPVKVGEASQKLPVLEATDPRPGGARQLLRPPPPQEAADPPAGPHRAAAVPSGGRSLSRESSGKETSPRRLPSLSFSELSEPEIVARGSSSLAGVSIRVPTYGTPRFSAKWGG